MSSWRLSPRVTRLAAMGYSLLNFIMGIVVLGVAGSAGNAVSDPDKIFLIFSDARDYMPWFAWMGIALAAVTLLGFVGANLRQKEIMLLQFILMFLVIALLFTAAAAFGGLLTARENGKMLPAATYDNGFRTAWEDLVEVATSGTESLEKTQASAFFTYMQTSAKCCGYDDAASELQNPAELGCTATTPCRAKFREYAADNIAGKLALYYTTAGIAAFFWIVAAMLNFQLRPKSERQHSGHSEIGQLSSLHSV